MIGKLTDQRFRYHSATAPGRSHFLFGKVVLLLGRSVAHIQEMAARLARQGADIALVGPPLPPMLAQHVRAGVESTGRRCLLLEYPDREPFDAERLIQTVTMELGRLDVFIDLTAQEPEPAHHASQNGRRDDAKQRLPDWQLMHAALRGMSGFD